MHAGIWYVRQDINRIAQVKACEVEMLVENELLDLNSHQKASKPLRGRPSLGTRARANSLQLPNTDVELPPFHIEIS
jgi:hypothetical protein